MDRKKKRLSNLKRPSMGGGTPTQTFNKIRNRVSFSNTNCVKEFLAGEDQLTIWGTSYEEEDAKNADSAGSANAALNAALNSTSNISFDWKIPVVAPPKKSASNVPEHDKENYIFNPPNETLDFTDLPNITASSFDFRSFCELPDITLNSFEEKKFRLRKDAQQTTTASSKPVMGANISQQSIHCSFLSETDRMMLKGIQPLVNEEEADNTIKLDWFHSQVDKMGLDDEASLEEKKTADEMEVYTENVKEVDNRPNKENTRRTIVFQEGDDLELDVPSVDFAAKPAEVDQKKESLPPIEDEPKGSMHYKNEPMAMEIEPTPSFSVELPKTANKRQTIHFDQGEAIETVSNDKVTTSSTMAQKINDTRKTQVFRAGEEICDLSAALKDENDTVAATIFSQKRVVPQPKSKPRQTIVFRDGEQIDTVSNGYEFKPPPPSTATSGILKKSRSTAIFPSGEDICDVSITEKNPWAQLTAGKSGQSILPKHRQTEVFQNDDICVERSDEKETVDFEPLKGCRKTIAFKDGEDIKDISMNAADSLRRHEQTSETRWSDLLVEPPAKSCQGDKIVEKSSGVAQPPAKSRHTEIFRDDKILEETLSAQTFAKNRQTEIFDNNEILEEMMCESPKGKSQLMANKTRPAVAGKSLSQSSANSRHTEIFGNDGILEETMCGSSGNEHQHDELPLKPETVTRSARHTLVFQNNDILEETICSSSGIDQQSSQRQKPLQSRTTRQTLIFQSNEVLEETMCDQPHSASRQQQIQLATKTDSYPTRQTEIFKNNEILEETMCSGSHNINQSPAPADPNQLLFNSKPFGQSSSVKTRHTEIFQNNEILEETMCRSPHKQPPAPVEQNQRPVNLKSFDPSLKTRQTEIFQNNKILEETMVSDRQPPATSHNPPLSTRRHTEIFASTEDIQDIEMDECNAQSTQIIPLQKFTTQCRPDDELNTMNQQQVHAPAKKPSRQTEIFQTGEDICDISMIEESSHVPAKAQNSNFSSASIRQAELLKNGENITGEDELRARSQTAESKKHRQTQVFTHEQIFEDSICDPVLATKSVKSSRQTEIFQAGEPIQDISMAEPSSKHAQNLQISKDPNWSFLSRNDTTLPDTMSAKKMGPLQLARQKQLLGISATDISTGDVRKFAHENSRFLTANRLDRSVFEDSVRDVTVDANTTKSMIMGGPLNYSRSLQMHSEDTCDVSLKRRRNQTPGPAKVSDRPFAEVSFDGTKAKPRQTIIFDRDSAMDESLRELPSDGGSKTATKIPERPFAQVSFPSTASATKTRQTIIFDRAEKIDDTEGYGAEHFTAGTTSASRKTTVFTSGDSIMETSMIASESGPNSSFQFTKPSNTLKGRAFTTTPSTEPVNPLYQTLISTNGDDICDMSDIADEHVPLVENSNQSHASKTESTLTRTGPLSLTGQQLSAMRNPHHLAEKTVAARHTQLFTNEGIIPETSSTQNSLRETVITHSSQKKPVASESSRRTFVIDADERRGQPPSPQNRRKTHVFPDEGISIEMDESLAHNSRQTVLVDNTKSPLKSSVSIPTHKDVRKTLVFASGEDITCETIDTDFNPHRSIAFRHEDVHLDQTLGFVPLAEQSHRSIPKSLYENNSPTTRNINLFRKHSAVNLNRSAPQRMSSAAESAADSQTTDSLPAISANTTQALGTLDLNAFSVGAGLQEELDKNAELQKLFKTDYAEVTLGTIHFSPSFYAGGEEIEKSHIDLVESFESTNPGEDESEMTDSPEVIEVCEASVMIISETPHRGKKAAVAALNNTAAELCRKCKNCRRSIFNDTAYANDSTWPDLKMHVAKATKLEMPKLNFDMLEKLQNQPSMRDIFNEYQNRRVSMQYSFDSASVEEETLRYPEAPSREYLLDNYAEEFRSKLENEDANKCIEPIFPIDKPFQFLFKNRLETENCNWKFNLMHLPAGVLQCHSKIVRSVCIVIRWAEKDLYRPGINQLEFKKVQFQKSPIYKNPSVYEKLAQNQVFLTTLSDLTGYCKNSNQLFTFLNDMEAHCAKAYDHMHQLLKATYKNKGSVKFDESGNCIARKIIYTDRKTVTGRRKIEFRIQLMRDIEEISYKDILMPPPSYFKLDCMRQLPTGVDFINSFLSNPVQYLRSS